MTHYTLSNNVKVSTDITIPRTMFTVRSSWLSIAGVL